MRNSFVSGRPHSLATVMLYSMYRYTAFESFAMPEMRMRSDAYPLRYSLPPNGTELLNVKMQWPVLVSYFYAKCSVAKWNSIPFISNAKQLHLALKYSVVPHLQHIAV